MEEIDTEIGNRIRIIREQKGFSQDNLASALGITQPSYARLEKDDKRISVTRLIQIASFLKTTVSELIDEKASKVVNQQHSNSPQAFVDSNPNFYADKDHIQSLKDEILHLKELVDKFITKK